jgi:uncharacterized membrane protein YgcG
MSGLFRRCRCLVLLCLLLLFGVSVGASSGYSPSDLKNPMLGPEEATFCGRPGVQRSAICDPDNIISQDSKNVIEGIINKVDRAEMAVVVVNSMSMYFKSFQTMESASQNFAKTIHDDWGVGDKNSLNGLVLFLSVGDRSWYVSTGKGLEDHISPALIDQVMENAKVRLRANNIDSALEGIVGEFEYVLSSDSQPPAGESSSGHSVWYERLQGCSIFGLFIAGVVLIAKHQEGRKRKLEKGKEALERLLKDVKDIRVGNKYQSTSCPICLEEFTVNDLGDSTDTGTSSIPAFKRVASLHCGHIFCRECITSHINTSTGDTCPICRESIDTNDSLRSRSTTSWWPMFRSSHVNNSYPVLHSRHPELSFRLHRLHSMYPSVMTDNSRSTLARALDENSLDEFVQSGEARLTIVNQTLAEMRVMHTRSGSGGSTRSSFGGGRSFGGKGGRW